MLQGSLCNETARDFRGMYKFVIIRFAKDWKAKKTELRFPLQTPQPRTKKFQF